MASPFELMAWRSDEKEEKRIAKETVIKCIDFRKHVQRMFSVYEHRKNLSLPTSEIYHRLPTDMRGINFVACPALLKSLGMKSFPEQVTIVDETLRYPVSNWSDVFMMKGKVTNDGRLNISIQGWWT